VIVEDWRLVQSLPAGTNNWTDNEFQISGTVNQASYKVRAVSGDGNLYSHDFSNTVSIMGKFLTFDQQPAPTTSVNLQRDLPAISITPNPFNNTIKITIIFPEALPDLVAIYDITGRLVRQFSFNDYRYPLTVF